MGPPKMSTQEGIQRTYDKHRLVQVEMISQSYGDTRAAWQGGYQETQLSPAS